MDTTSLYYFIEAAKDLNFTRTAGRLFLSQQNLSHHIAKLETLCGTKLFQRKPCLSLTYEGEVFLHYAKSAVAAEKNILSSLSSITNENAGHLQIGMTTSKSILTLPQILPAFYALYPGVRIELVERPVSTLQELLINDSLDFAVGIFHPSPELQLIHLIYEKVYLCMSESLLRQYRPDFTIESLNRAKSGITVGAFPNLPVVFPHDNAVFSQVLSSCYTEAGLSPNILLSVTYPQLYHQLYTSGTVAAFMTETNLDFFRAKNKEAESGFHAFPLLYNGKFLSRELSLAMNRSHYLSKPARQFISMTQTFLNSYDASAC